MTEIMETFDGTEYWFQRHLSDMELSHLIKIFRHCTNNGKRPAYNAVGKDLNVNPNYISEAWHYWCYLVEIFD